MLQPYLEAGKLVGTHGIQGELKAEPWCDSPEFLKKRKTLYRKENGTFVPMSVEGARIHKNLVLLKLAGITTIEQGDALRGTVLYIDRKDVQLPKGRYFIADLLGLAVVDVDTGKTYGKITEVLKPGANDVYEVTDDVGKTYLLPVIENIVLDTDLEAGTVTVRPIKGIFDHAD